MFIFQRIKNMNYYGILNKIKWKNEKWAIIEEWYNWKTRNWSKWLE